MTLLDRIARDTSLPDAERVSGHRVENAMKLYCHGHITRTQMINFFGIPANMESDFDQFKTKYDSLGVAAAEKWLMDFEACVIGLQNGDISKSTFNTFLGTTLDET